MQTATGATMLERARKLAPEITNWRRTIHAHPELSFQEHKTAAFVADALSSLGARIQLGVGGTGVVAEIGDAGAHKIVALRADMDALPICEANELPHGSKNEGVMHACGHDAHVACLLGAAKLLQEEFSQGAQGKCVRLLFQPAEETVNAENKSGATLLIEAGALQDVSALLALHVFPGLPTGAVGLRNGALLAACDSFDITIRGKGSHGAMPELGIDAIVLASHAVQALQTVVSRRLAASDIGVLTVGGIRSLTYAPNIVAEAVEMTGTVRYMEKRLHEQFLTEIKRALSIVEALGGTYELNYHYDTPALCNNDNVTETVRDCAKRLLGEKGVIDVPPVLGADDFSFYTDHVPSCYFALGAAIEGSKREFHTATFDIDEDAMPIGSAVLAESALELLKG